MSEQLEYAIKAASQTLGERGLGATVGVLVLLIGWIIAGRTARTVQRACERSGKIDATLTPLFSKVARLSVLVITIIVALDEAGIDTTSLVAFLGAMGVAIGLALKDTIADLAAGIVLVVLRPVSVGDAADIGGILGTVEGIDLFQTRVRTFDGVPIVVPNSKIRSGAIHNFTRASQRRIDLSIGIAYEASIQRATEVITEVLGADSRILGDPEPMIAVEALGDSSVNLLVRFWVPAADLFPAKFDTTRGIKQALDAAGIEIPYPKRDVIVTQKVA